VKAADPRISFSKVKISGFGKKLFRLGMLEFVNIKPVRFYNELTYQHHMK
jgi:succinate-semialdehyde dehydrogenase/glutarate-semialdehyde dehydrogenase/succinyl-CoA reductase